MDGGGDGGHGYEVGKLEGAGASWAMLVSDRDRFDFVH